MKRITMFSAVLVALAGLFALGVAQQSNTGEVRINAKRLDDGRTEFALQQRDGSGWGERISPRGRFLPAEPPLG